MHTKKIKELDPTQEAYFKKLATYWESVEEECQDIQLTGQTDWTFPKWAEGIFMSSGPSKHFMNDTKFTHINDGFGRFSTFKFKEGKVTYTSKMLDSNFYNESLKEGDVIPGLLFSETSPPRWKSHFPMMNLIYMGKGTNDNNWVDMELMPDRKTFVATTDSPEKLKIDINSLKLQGKIEWEDEGFCMSGVSHSRTMPDGTMLSICNDQVKDKKSPYPLEIVVYKMDPSNPFKRIKIATIPSKRFSIQHSFAVTQDYAIIFEPPYYADVTLWSLIFKNMMLQDYIKNDVNGTLKIHLVRLKDGQVTTVDTN